MRDPLYREVADLIVDTGRQGVQVLLRQVITTLSDHMRTIGVELGDRAYPIEVGSRN